MTSPTAVDVVLEYKDLLDRTEGLVREFHPDLPAGTVIKTVIDCRKELLRTGHRQGLVNATEARARARLQMD